MYYNNKKLLLSIFWVVLGIVLVVLSVLEILNSSLCSGIGGGLIAVGILQIIKNRKYISNEEYRKKIDVEANDERNAYLRMKSWSWTGYIMVLLFGIASIVCMIIGKNDTAVILSYIVCAEITVYWVVYLILRKKY